MKNTNICTEILIYPRHAWVKRGGSSGNGFVTDIVYVERDLHSGPHPDRIRWLDRDMSKPGPGGSQIVIMNDDDREVDRAVVGATAAVSTDILTTIETQIMSSNANACNESAARIEQGRRDWATMSQDQRDALNAYALKTEGHTIDHSERG